MPPTKRAKKNPPADQSAPVLEDDPANVAAHSNGKSGSLDILLPIELWFEILSHFPAVKVPAIVRNDLNQPGLRSTYLERPRVLRALSQLNQAMRSTFLPILWERLEACAGDDSAWFKVFGEVLRSRSAGLVRTKKLAVYVQYVNVVLTRFQTHSVLPAFSKCLSILPNVHTIQILHAHSAMTTALKDAFRGHTFPSVKTIFLPEQAHEVLRCCPNLRKVVCIQGSGSKLVTAIAKAAKHVEELENFRVDEALVKRIVKAVPNLRTTKIYDTQSLDAIRLMSSLKKLTTIEIFTHHKKDGHDHPQPIKNCMAVVREVLQKQTSGKKIEVK